MSTAPAPKWFVPVSVVALLWNLLGCFAYLRNVTMSPAAIAALPADEQAMFRDFPVWAVAGMAIAVWGGALGSLALILKKGWAVPVFALSILGLVVQDIGMYRSMQGSSTASSGLAVQGVVLVIAIALLMLARKARANGWVS